MFSSLSGTESPLFFLEKMPFSVVKLEFEFPPLVILTGFRPNVGRKEDSH